MMQIYTNMRLAVALSQAYGFKCLFYLEPGLVRKKYLSNYEMKVIKHETQPAYQSFISLSYDTLEKEAPTLSANFPYHDISCLFTDVHEGIFIDSGHMGERGNALVAQRILQDVEPFARAINTGKNPVTAN
jgi:hypothetical protein